MSDEPPADLDLIAAEFVLGTLDTATARDIAVRATREPALASAIAAWERRLAPLADLAEPVAPPAALWSRLAGSAGLAAPPAKTDGPTAQITPFRRAWGSLSLWRATTAAGFALAAGIAAFALVRTPPEPQLAALVPAGSAAAAFVAERMPDGRLRLVAMHPAAVPNGKDMELWMLASGDVRPISLGVVPASAVASRMAIPAMPKGAVQLLVSLEPSGGSPTGLPTGPVLYQGALDSAN